MTADRIERYHVPVPRGYAARVMVERGSRLASLAFPDVVVTVDELIG